MLTVEQRLLANHFAIQNGQPVDVVKNSPDSRILSLSYQDRIVVVQSRGETRSFPLPRPVQAAPDPGDISIEIGAREAEVLLDSISSYPINARLSLYQEERRVCSQHFTKQQRTGFYIIILYEEQKSYIYSDFDPDKLHKLCLIHVLPRRTLEDRACPFVLSSNVVGHIFHEYAHLLEMDLVGIHKAQVLEGKQVFSHAQNIRVFEDPTAASLGLNAFTDEGRVPGRMPLIINNLLAGFLDSFSYPYRHLGCGYLGYGENWFPIPRTTNLVVEADCVPYNADRYVTVTELNLQLESSSLLKTAIHISGGEGVYVERGIPLFRVELDFDIRTTLQDMVARLRFIDFDTGVAPIGGMCMKREIQIRSAQVSPPALWQRT